MRKQRALKTKDNIPFYEFPGKKEDDASAKMLKIHSSIMSTTISDQVSYFCSFILDVQAKFMKHGISPIQETTDGRWYVFSKDEKFFKLMRTSDERYVVRLYDRNLLSGIKRNSKEKVNLLFVFHIHLLPTFYRMS